MQKETQYPIVGSNDGVWEETMKLNEEAAGLPKVSAELSPGWMRISQARLKNQRFTDCDKEVCCVSRHTPFYVA